MEIRLTFSVVIVFVVLLCGQFAEAGTVSYVANLNTAAGNPVTDLLILEESSGGLVQASVFGTELPGFGTSLISHNPGFEPVKSLIIGLTEGVDGAGAPKTQIIAFLDNAFAAANLGKKWSEVFVGTRHSVTITNLEAAVAGDTAQQAWFTNTFYPGPAAGAAFVTGGSFTVGEFTNLDPGGSSAISGNWVINQLTDSNVDGEDFDSRDSFLIDETAQVDLGPFDIELALNNEFEFAIDKTVLNNTGVDWRTFVMELGMTVDGEFIPSTANDGLGFVDTANFPIREETGAFPDVLIEEDRLVFTGGLADAATAQFIAFIDSDTSGNHTFTLHQYAIATANSIPEPTSLWLLALGLLASWKHVPKRKRI